MLHFPVNTLPSSLEDFLRTTRESPERILRMPVGASLGGGFGGAAHAVQTIATWARITQGTPVLRLSPSFVKEIRTRERFSSTLPGMAALYFSDGIENDGSVLGRFRALNLVAPRVLAMQEQRFKDTLRGQAIALCCFAGAHSEFLSALYARPSYRGVRDASGFRLLLPRMLRSLGDRLDEHIPAKELDFLSALLHQLFLNADEHGSTDVYGDNLDRAMRGISMRLNTVPNLEALLKYAEEDAALKAYLVKLPLAASRQSNSYVKAFSSNSSMQILELSVFDTGPGLALRWLSEKKGVADYRSISLEDELEAVQTCFVKHATTKQDSLRGEGLTMALRALTQLNAFMSLRTGRLSLYQDFSRTEVPEFQPKRRFRTNRKMPEISGTSFTVCFRVK